jgi:hypothetical protein
MFRKITEMNDKEKTRIILPIPENLGRTREREEKIRSDSILYIAGNSGLTDHLEILQDVLNLIFDISIVYKSIDRNEKTLQIIGYRLFNSSLVAYKLMLSGYYQASLALQRDILETSFLLSYFGIDNSKIEQWRKSTRKDRLRYFNPSFICQELDKRDNFKEGKRAKYYHLFCEYATHMTPKCPKLLTVAGTINIGPFFYEFYLNQCLFELVKLVVLSALKYTGLFKTLPREYMKEQQNFLHKFQEWIGKYPFGPPNVKDLDKWLE